VSIINEDLRTEIDGILRNYNVPMDDRGLVIDKIEGSVDGVLSAEREAFSHELDVLRGRVDTDRENVMGEISSMREQAQEGLDGIDDKLEDAYEDGLRDGLKTVANYRPGLFQVVGIVAVAGVIGYLAFRCFWRK